jgi:uncharacterized cupin superfamily protein
MVPEAPMQRTDAGLVPGGEGWFVLNARESRWFDGVFGSFTNFEGEHRFSQLGINIAILEPGQPACMYHREVGQEDFLVLSGTPILLIEGEERRCKPWDLVHCPSWTEHVFVGAGDTHCVIVGVGSRAERGVVYPVSELAQSHSAGVPEETDAPKTAYAPYPQDDEVPYREGWLPS